MYYVLMHASQPEKCIVGLRKRLKMVLQSRKIGPNRTIYRLKFYGKTVKNLIIYIIL